MFVEVIPAPAQPSNGNIEAAWFTPGSVLRLSLSIAQCQWTHFSVRIPSIMSDWFLLELNITEPMKHVANVSTSYFGSYR